MEERDWMSILSKRNALWEWDRDLVNRSASWWLVGSWDTWSFLEATKSQIKW